MMTIPMLYRVCCSIFQVDTICNTDLVLNFSMFSTRDVTKMILPEYHNNTLKPQGKCQHSCSHLIKKKLWTFCKNCAIGINGTFITKNFFIQNVFIYIIEATKLFTIIYIITPTRDQLGQGSNKQCVSPFFTLLVLNPNP